MLQERLLPCHSREAVVTVLSYHNGIMDGYLQHPRLERRERFQSLSQMLLLLDSLLNLEGSLHSPLPLVAPECEGLEHMGAFRIQILFREHYTWQGRLIWLDENQEIVFHSALELLQIIDEILAR